MFFARSAAQLGVALTLCACGGGTRTPPAATIAAPRVVAAVPAAGASNVDPTSEIAVRFVADSDLLARASVVLEVRDSAGTLEGSTVMSTTDAELRWRPAGLFALGSTVEATVTMRVDGEESEPFAWAFTVRDGAFGRPTVRATVATPGTPRIVTSDVDTPLVTLGPNVWARDVGGSWSARELGMSVIGTCQDPGGHALLLGCDERCEVYSTIRRDPDGAFGLPETLISLAGWPLRNASLSANELGEFLIEITSGVPITQAPLAKGIYRGTPTGPIQWLDSYSVGALQGGGYAVPPTHVVESGAWALQLEAGELMCVSRVRPDGRTLLGCANESAWLRRIGVDRRGRGVVAWARDALWAVSFDASAGDPTAVFHDFVRLHGPGFVLHRLLVSAHGDAILSYGFEERHALRRYDAATSTWSEPLVYSDGDRPQVRPSARGEFWIARVLGERILARRWRPHLEPSAEHEVLRVDALHGFDFAVDAAGRATFAVCGELSDRAEPALWTVRFADPGADRQSSSAADRVRPFARRSK